MCKVVHMTSVHKAHDVRIFHKECRSLVSRGYNVVLIAPGDKDDLIQGVRIKAVPRFKNRWKRMLIAPLLILWYAFKERADIYHFHDPELIPIGVILRFLSKNVVYDVHEDLPRQLLGKGWIPVIFRKFFSLLTECTENLASKMFNGIAAATPTIARRFQPSKTIVLHNYPIADELKQDKVRKYAERGDNVVYVGGISKSRGISEIITSMGYVNKRRKADLMLVGMFNPNKLEQEMKSKESWRYVDYIGWQDRTGVRTHLANAKVGLVTLHPKINYVDALPIKLFEYMAAGIPVVASDFPLWREIINRSKCGLLVNPLEPREIADAIVWLLDNPDESEKMGMQGQKAVEELYNWDNEMEKLDDLYKRII